MDNIYIGESNNRLYIEFVAVLVLCNVRHILVDQGNPYNTSRNLL